MFSGKQLVPKKKPKKTPGKKPKPKAKPKKKPVGGKKAETDRSLFGDARRLAPLAPLPMAWREYRDGGRVWETDFTSKYSCIVK